MVGNIKQLPYTSRGLMKCFDAGAEAFGWKQRNPKPGSMQDGDWLIGMGCATTLYPTQISPAAVRVTLSPDGEALVQTAAHDIGNGAYTVVALTAAGRLGIPLDKVTVALGDSDLPPAPVAGGSNTTASVCNVVQKACDEVMQRVAQAGQTRRNADIVVYAENVPDGAKPGAMQNLARGIQGITGGSKLPDRLEFAFGAEFVELRIHKETREIRCPRILGRVRRRQDRQPPHRRKPADGRIDLGPIVGAARGDRDRRPHRALCEHQSRGLPAAGERRCRGGEGHHAAGGGTPR